MFFVSQILSKQQSLFMISARWFEISDKVIALRPPIVSFDMVQSLYISLIDPPSIGFIILIILSYLTIHYSRRVKFLEEIQLLLIPFFFILAISLNVYSDPYHLGTGTSILSHMLFFVFLILTIVESNLFHSRRKEKEIAAICLFCFVMGLVVALVTYPIFKQFDTFNLYFRFLLILPQTDVPFFYVLVPIQAITSGLIGYSLMSLFDSFSSMIREKPQQPMNLKESAFLHLQIVPLALFPLLIAQLFSETVFFDPITKLLYALCVSQFLGLICCSILAILGEKIYKIRFLLIRSIFTLISVISSVYVAFLFIIAHVEVGTYLLAIITTSLTALAVGITISRVSDQFS